MSDNITTCNPYLGFNGNCREAMIYYAEALKGKLDIMTFADAPFETPADYKDKVLHSAVAFGDSALIMASDNMPDSEFVMGTNSYISVSCPDLVEATRIFNALSEDGTVTMPFDDVFWGAKFGSLTDKYGMNWMVNCQESGSATE